MACHLFFGWIAGNAILAETQIVSDVFPGVSEQGDSSLNRFVFSFIPGFSTNVSVNTIKNGRKNRNQKVHNGAARCDHQKEKDKGA
jgi:hypothetical protein